MLNNILSTIDLVLRLLGILIVVNAFMSLIVTSKSNQYARALSSFLEPILKPCYMLQKKFIPTSPIDFSPFIAIILIEMVRYLIIGLFSW